MKITIEITEKEIKEFIEILEGDDKKENGIDEELIEKGKNIIAKWLDKYVDNVGEYVIYDDLSVDVEGHVDISNLGLTEIPIQFGYVEGDFICCNNKLKTLEGSPYHVGGDFNCYRNNLISLEHSPEHVGGNFNCANNRIRGLQGSPKYINDHFDCCDNEIHSLEGSPAHVGGWFLAYNNKFESLDGSPEYVGLGFSSENFRLNKNQYDEIKKIN